MELSLGCECRQCEAESSKFSVSHFIAVCFVCGGVPNFKTSGIGAQGEFCGIDFQTSGIGAQGEFCGVI